MSPVERNTLTRGDCVLAYPVDDRTLEGRHPVEPAGHENCTIA
jgi:hypothetical protein